MAVYTVAQVTKYIRDVLEGDQLLADLWVNGEVANVARPGSGHVYFTIRDSDASLRCVMFRAAESGGADVLTQGAAVISHGRVSIYEVRGDLQMIVDIVQPEGVGELQLKFEQLKLKLESEGLFDVSRKRELPEFPSRVGVITSPSSAAWHDIQTVVARRYPLAELVLAPTPVQGESAAPGVVEAFSVLNELADLDVVILARGGGSLEDLWPFNEEAVARAVFSSRGPVITGIGHETDTTIADMVADRRAPTPSAAAEVAVPDGQELAFRIANGGRRLIDAAGGYVVRGFDALGQLDARIQRVRPDLDTIRLRIDDLLGKASLHLRHALESQKIGVQGLEGRLKAVSPAGTLRRGYAIVQSPSAGVVTDSRSLKKGEPVEVTLSRGAFGAAVTSIQERSDGHGAG